MAHANKTKQITVNRRSFPLAKRHHVLGEVLSQFLVEEAKVMCQVSYKPHWTIELTLVFHPATGGVTVI